MLSIAVFTAGFTLCSLLLSVFLRTPLVEWFGDSPDHRKVHWRIVPRFGGLAMVASFLTLLAFAPLIPGYGNFGKIIRLFPSFFITGGFLLLSGTLDDVRPVSFKLKFALQFALAGILVLILKNGFNSFSFLGYRMDLEGAGNFISIFWLVLLMNAINIIDGIDGLAGGTALFGFASVAMVARSGGQSGLAWLCVLLIGITAAFLFRNFHPRRKVFLGDTGSQFLGAMLGLLTMQVQGLTGVGHSLLIPLLIVGYPLADLGIAMARRFIAPGAVAPIDRFLRMFEADNDHLHHRLVHLGLSHAQSSFLLLLMAATFPAGAFILARTEWRGTVAVFGYLAFMILMILNHLGFVGKRHWVVSRKRENPLRDEKRRERFKLAQ